MYWGLDIQTSGHRTLGVFKASVEEKKKGTNKIYYELKNFQNPPMSGVPMSKCPNS